MTVPEPPGPQTLVARVDTGAPDGKCPQAKARTPSESGPCAVA